MPITHRAEELMAMIALGLVDLRAQYQAAMRALEHAEKRLSKCRQPQDEAAFQGFVSALREDVMALSNTNRSVREVLDEVARDADRLTPESV
jgi:hypothetical protein